MRVRLMTLEFDYGTLGALELLKASTVRSNY